MNRSINIHTYPTETNDRVVKAWLSHDRERKVYRLTVVPAERKTYSDGRVMETIKAYSGFVVRVADAPRFSEKTLEKLARSPEVLDIAGSLALELGATDGFLDGDV